MAKEILFNEEARRALGRGVVMLYWIKNSVPQQSQMMV